MVADRASWPLRVIETLVLLAISGGMIIDRQRVEEDDNCASETYEPIESG